MTDKEKSEKEVLERFAEKGLRMFPEKKKPILEVGTKIRFSDGKIGILKRETTHYGKLYYVIELKDGVCMDFDYLIGKIWEVVE